MEAQQRLLRAEADPRGEDDLATPMDLATVREIIDCIRAFLESTIYAVLEQSKFLRMVLSHTSGLEDKAIIHLLCRRGADRETNDPDSSEMILFSGLRRKHPRSLFTFLNQGSDAQICEADSFPTLLPATILASPPTLTALFSYGAHVYARGPYGESALH